MWQHMWLPCLHTSACSVGLSLGVEVLPATCSPCTPPASLGRNSSSCHAKEMLKLPLQLTEGGRHFSRGAKMQLQLSRIGFGEEHEPFLSVHTRPLDQSSVSCTSLSSGVLSSVCPCLSTIAILRPPSPSFLGRSLHAGPGLQTRLCPRARHAFGPDLAHRKFPSPPLRLLAVCLLQR